MAILANIRIQTITVILIGLVGLITFISFALGYTSMSFDSAILEKVFKLFNVDFERNIPTWFSSTLLALVGLCYMMIAYYRQHIRKDYVAHWLFLGFIFLAISLDEFGQFHEQSIRPLRDVFDTSGFLYYPWIFPAALLTIGVGLGYYRFLQELLWETKTIFIVAGLFYVGGALGVEAIGGYYFDNFMRIQQADYDMFYLFITHFEELCEMIGIVLFLHVGMRYVQIMGLSQIDKSTS